MLGVTMAMKLINLKPPQAAWLLMAMSAGVHFLIPSRYRGGFACVICGAVMRSIRIPKKPTSATVTATMAAIRAVPSDLRNSASPCTKKPAPVTSYPGKNCLVHGYQRVKKLAGRRLDAGLTR